VNLVSAVSETGTETSVLRHQSVYHKHRFFCVTLFANISTVLSVTGGPKTHSTFFYASRWKILPCKTQTVHIFFCTVVRHGPKLYGGFRDPVNRIFCSTDQYYVAVLSKQRQSMWSDDDDDADDDMNIYKVRTVLSTLKVESEELVVAKSVRILSGCYCLSK